MCDTTRCRRVRCGCCCGAERAGDGRHTHEAQRPPAVRNTETAEAGGARCGKEKGAVNVSLIMAVMSLEDK
jgi:hypothetical protein